MTKYIFITGGVVSGLGKGITASSIGFLLKASGLNIFMQKFDPYLNIDSGTMNPYQHGEVFVTIDGTETDLDLGHYERFIDENLTKNSNITSGQIYKSVIEKERKGEYNGETVQIVPHVTNEIKNKIYNSAIISKANIIITEIGGTVGDIESLPFIEAIRQIIMELGRKNVICMHVSLVPYISILKESKTKPTQHSIKILLSLGIQPDIIIARTEQILNENIIKKISLFCNIEKRNVFVVTDVENIYKIPLKMYEQNLQISISKLLNLKITKTDILLWKCFIKKINSSKRIIEIKIVGKYVELPDAYLSIIESLKIAGYENNVKIKIDLIKSENINKKNYKKLLKNAKGILVPGGFGKRGFEGKILTCKFARENNIPFFGICFGMQAAIIEFARNVCFIKDANSSELVKTKNAVIDIISGKEKENYLGGTLRLGNYKTTLLPNTLVYKLYGKNEILERHRHRYEVNNYYKEKLLKAGLIFSGFYMKKNLVEVVELKEHPFFIAVQYHPEFTSRPNKPNLLFNGFIQAIIKNKKNIFF